MNGAPMKGPIIAKTHPLYRRWAWMRQVCSNPRSADYKSYGAKGIKVGKEFAEFWDFVDIIEHRLGLPPNGRLSKLARINQDGNYTIKNLKWDDAKTVGRRCPRTYKLTYKGKTMALKDWSEIVGVNYYTMINRIELGWSPAQVLGFKPGPRALAIAKKKKMKK